MKAPNGPLFPAPILQIVFPERDDEGLSGLRPGRNLYVKPYLTAPLIRLQGNDVDFVPDAGFDLKYGLGSQLTLDLTVNTEFS